MGRNEKIAPLLLLSENVLHRICGFLPLDDLLAISLTSSFFQRRSHSPWLEAQVSGILKIYLAKNHLPMDALTLESLREDLLRPRVVDLIAFERLYNLLNLGKYSATYTTTPGSVSCDSDAPTWDHKNPLQSFMVLLRTNGTKQNLFEIPNFSNIGQVDKENLALENVGHRNKKARKEILKVPTRCNESSFESFENDGLFVSTSGDLIGWKDKYTDSMTGLGEITQQLKNGSKHCSWLKLTLLHSQYLSIIGSIIISQKEQQPQLPKTWISREERISGNELYSNDFTVAFGASNKQLRNLYNIALQGHAFAQNDLAITWINLQGSYEILANLPFNWGVFWFKQASARGLGLAKYCLATCLAFPDDQKAKPENNGETINAQIFEKIYVLYRSAALLNVPEAQTNVGMIYYGDFPGNAQNQHIYKDYEAAEKWWREAARFNQPDALLNLGLLLRKENRRNESFQFLLRAAHTRSNRACFLVAKSFEEGDGVSKDINQALHWFKVALDTSNTFHEKQHLQSVIKLILQRYY
eukprot:maker-scaffold_2-snap-gene-18.6-mRNA-1 protein AED:0.00 eAED:0.00 QI:118/1/1/1/1/1/3/199/527